MEFLSEDNLKILRRDAEKLCQKGKTPGVQCALFTKDKILFSYGYGMINETMGIATDLHSCYMIGSNTKMLTAMCCMKLYEEGKLDLQADIRTYLPDFSLKDQDVKITAENLLQHRSGLPGDFFGLTRDQGMESVLWALKEAKLSYEPGTMFSYSNVGYVLLGLIIEKIVSCSYESYVKHAIGTPLGIEICFEKPELSRFSCSYDKKGQEVEDFTSSLPGAAAGTCTYMSMEDFVKFGQVFLNNGAPILKKETMDLMESLPEHDPLDRDLMGYGYGLIHNQYHFPRVTVLGHGGDTICHHSVFNYIPEMGIGVAVMTNGANGMVPAKNLSLLMIRTCLREEGRTAVIPERSSRNKAVSQEIVGNFITIMGPMNIVRDHRGYYQTNLKGIKVQLRPAGEGWLHCAPGSLVTTVPSLRKQIDRIFVKPDVYRGKPVLLAVFRHRDYWNMCVLGVPGKTAPVTSSFLQAQGTYEAADPRIREGMPMTLRLTEKDGRLQVSVDMDLQKCDFVLAPEDYRTAVIQGYGRFAGERISVNPEAHTAEYSGITFKMAR